MEALAREHESTLYAVALRMSREPSLARDLVQDTFERAMSKLDQFQSGTNARAWLTTIMTNLYVDRCRKRAREPIHEPIEDHPAVVAVQHEEAPAWARFSGEQLRVALAALSEDFRRVYELHAIEGRSYDEIAKELKIPKATVGTRLIRARRKLKELLLKQGRKAQEGEG